MTLRTNARVAGYAYLLYIAIGISTMVISRALPEADGTLAQLAVMDLHAGTVRLNMVLGFVTALIALTLGVALHALTRDQDRDLALLALLCRVGEGLAIFVPLLATLGLLWLASEGGGGDGTLVLAAFLMKLKGWNVTIAATFFAVGSTLFCWLFLRGRLIPTALAWLGVVASVLLVVSLTRELIVGTASATSMIIWIPMGVFEIVLGVWLIVKGVAQAPVPIGAHE